MRTLVLGGTGLISTAIVERLLEEGHEPVLYNRCQTPSRITGDVETIRGDRQDFEGFASDMASRSFDAVIDMITFDADTAAHNVEVFDGRVQHYLFCSTVCVYGGPLTQVPADEDEPHTPVSAYGRQKSEAETVFTTAHQSSAFPVTIFRPSHCYGVGRPLLDIFGYSGALVTRIREGLPILVPGDGYGLWQPGYTGDVAKGFVGALGRAATHGNVYNIVGDEIMDWRGFHAAMGKAIGRETNLVAMTTEQIKAGSPEGKSGMLEEIFQYHAAYTNARLKADVPEFTDLLPFEEGVRRVVTWMDELGMHQPSDAEWWIDELVAKEKAFRESFSG